MLSQTDRPTDKEGESTPLLSTVRVIESFYYPEHTVSHFYTGHVTERARIPGLRCRRVVHSFCLLFLLLLRKQKGLNPPSPKTFFERGSTLDSRASVLIYAYCRGKPLYPTRNRNRRGEREAGSSSQKKKKSAIQ